MLNTLCNAVGHLIEIAQECMFILRIKRQFKKRLEQIRMRIGNIIIRQNLKINSNSSR